MNKKNLAIKISKHPLLRKLTEDKTIPNSVVARLIVEEMTEEEITDIDSRMDSLAKTENAEEAKQLKSKIEQLISTKLPDGQENRLMAYMTQLNGIIQQNSNVEKEPESGSNIDKYENAINKAKTREEIVDIQNQIKADETLINDDLLALNDIIETALEDIDEPVDKEKTETSENPYKDIEGYADLKLDKEQETIFISFLNKLKEQKIIKEGNLRGLNKILGTESQKLADIIKSFEEPQMGILIELLKDDKIQAFIQKNLSNITEPETGGETSGETKDPPPSEIPEAEKKQYVDASTKLQNEFYNQKYRIQQAELIGAVIDAIEIIYDNPNKVAAFSRPPQEPKPVSEQQETVEASKDELRNLRVDFRSFLSRVNKTSKALEKFEEMKDSGSMITDTYKKQFIDLLKEVQMSIKRIHRDLQVIIGKRQINEIDENSDVMKKWKEVEGKYNKAVASASALRELIDGTSTSEEPEQIIQDTYASLSDLSTHFPSINPFASSGAKTREDMNKYKNSFENAVKQVKSDLQNVLALINQGQSGEDTLQLAMEGLKTFSGAIQNTFGIQSQFKDIKVEKDTPAAQGKPQAQKKRSYKDRFADYLTDNILSFLGKLISRDKNERDIKNNIEKQKEIEPEEKEAAMELVKKYRLTELQQEAKMTSGEMQLYIKLLIALQEQGIVKLNEIVVTDDIQNVIGTFDQEEQETLMGILKKQGVYRHLLSLRTDEFGEEGYETFDSTKEELIKKIKDFNDGDAADANLSGADLSGADLSEGDLYAADLSDANLSGANLSFADLTNADLTGANLTNSDLTNAVLINASLSFADLSGADLSGADLTNAGGGNFQGAKFSKDTSFAWSDPDPDDWEDSVENDFTDSERSLADKVEFLNNMKGDIVLRHGDEDKNYIIKSIEENSDGDIDIIYKKSPKNEEQLLAVSEESIEEFYKAIQDEGDPNRFNALHAIKKPDGEKLPFSFKLIKPHGSFEKDPDATLSERIEKLIKPLIKEMLTKGK